MGVENYYFEAPQTANFPYIVWETRAIGSLDDASDLKQYIFEINAYHKSSTLILDILLDEIEKKLDGNMYSEKGFSVNIYYSDSRMDIDEGREIKRKRTQYEIRYFYKEC